MTLAADPTAAVRAPAPEGTEDAHTLGAVSLRGPAARTAPGPDAEHRHALLGDTQREVTPSLGGTRGVAW